MTEDPKGAHDVACNPDGPTRGDRVPPPDVPGLDHVYEALGHPRRRYLCYTLFEETEWSLTDLATKIATCETETPEHAVTDRDRERVYVSLYHAHVPKLVEEGHQLRRPDRDDHPRRERRPGPDRPRGHGREPRHHPGDARTW